jgi:large subunit ribosomal protein L22
VTATTSNDDMEAPAQARAVARHVRLSASKARRIVDLIRGMSAEEAVTVLRFSPQAAADPVRKVLQSAMANAEQTLDADPGTLRVARAYVDEGSTFKRWRARAQGRPGPLLKRSCHITVIVEPVEEEPAATSTRSSRRNRRAR